MRSVKNTSECKWRQHSCVILSRCSSYALPSCLFLNFKTIPSIPLENVYAFAAIFLVGAALYSWRLPQRDDNWLLHEEMERKIAAEFRQMSSQSDGFRERKKRLEERFGKYSPFNVLFSYILHIREFKKRRVRFFWTSLNPAKKHLKSRIQILLF